MWFKKFREELRKERERNDPTSPNYNPRVKWTVGWQGEPRHVTDMIDEEMEQGWEAFRAYWDNHDKPGDDETPDPKAEGSS